MKATLVLICIASLSKTTHAADYAAWAAMNPAGTWTRAAERAVGASNLSTLVPADIDLYCPHYAASDDTDRARFWTALLSAMAGPESDFNPATRFVEPRIFDAKGRHVVSRGLLQISMESANQPRYHCGIKRSKDLHNPGKNLACATKILNHWVAADGTIGARQGENLGGARYWSVLRREKTLSQIQAFTQQLSFCAVPPGLAR